MSTDVRLPELGENITAGTIARILVSVGDTVAEGQSLLEIETDKAVAEIPSPAAGSVTEIRVKEGQKVNVGDVLCVLAAGAAAAAPQPKAATPEPPPVGPPAPKPAPAAVTPAPAPAPAPKSLPARAPAAITGGPVVASPSVRRLARELGVDIEQVPPGDASGRVSAEDVRRFAAGETAAPAAEIPASAPPPAPSATVSLQPGKWGEEARETMNAIRRKTAERMAANWREIPHVTQHDRADITALEAARKKYGPAMEAAGAKLTVTSFLVKVIVEALKRFPKFNASVDMPAQEIVYKRYYNIGVAADTEHGLVVPVIHNADTLSIAEISRRLGELAAKARTRKLTLDEMQGGTFTISNLGGIGGTGFTPIINAPEVAILGVSRSSIEPVYLNGQFAPRLMMPLSLSYDHRVIDGADAARFLRWTAEALEQPWSLFLEA